MFLNLKSIKKLEQVQEILSKIPNINYGGCAISALAMYRWLKKHNQLTSNTTIVYSFPSKEDWYFKNNTKALKNNTKGYSCRHAFIFHEGRFMDCNGFIKNTNYKNYKIKINNEQFVIDSINNVEADWNLTFDRKYVNVIAKRLNIDLSDVIIKFD